MPRPIEKSNQLINKFVALVDLYCSITSPTALRGYIDLKKLRDSFLKCESAQKWLRRNNGHSETQRYQDILTSTQDHARKYSNLKKLEQ